MKKRKKKKLKRSILFLLIIFIIVFGIFIYKNNNSFNTKYNDDVINVLKENNNSDVLKKDYSKTLEEMINNNMYNEIYTDEYIKINYIDKDDFLKNVNIYLNKGYDANSINNIFKLSNLNQEKLLNMDKVDFNKYINIKNFDVNKIDRYNSYMNETNKDINTVVTHVNISLDKEFYDEDEMKKVEDPNSVTALINKFHYVDKDFVPKDLVVLFDSKIGAKMVKVAADAYKELINKATSDGYTLESTTAYRSYSFQNTLYTNYVKQDGVKEADTYSARPGTSEHQLGLAVDLNDPNVSGKRLDDKDYNWLLENSYKFGFIVRYTEDGVPITGYMEEPWHIRYLGVELATKVYESKLTYDEYYDLYMTEY